MAELKKAVNKMEEQGIPRAVLSEGILTIDVDSHVETMEEQEDARWHQLLNAHRTKKILTGQLGGIEKLDSGWTVAITYYNGFRILIPMDEMMINLSGDGREHSDTLNRQTRIANNMLGSDIDFIIRDLDEQSRSVVASRKDAMLKKRQMFYFNEDEEEKPMLYPGRIVEARVIAVAPKVVRLEVFGVEVSVRARDMAWEWMVDASEKFQVGDLTLVMVNQINIRSVEEMEISVDAKSATANVNKDNLKRCVRQENMWVSLLMYIKELILSGLILASMQLRIPVIWQAFRQNVTRWDLLLPELTISLRWQKALLPV